MTGMQPGTFKKAFEQLKDALRGPIHRARKGNYERLHQLKDLQQIVHQAIEPLELPQEPVSTLLHLADLFDRSRDEERVANLELIVALLRAKQKWVPAQASDGQSVPWREWVDESLGQLKGVGPATAQKLHQSGFHSMGDLLLCFPRTHILWEHRETFETLQAGECVVVCGEVVHAKVRFGRGRRYEVLLQDDTGRKLTLVFFQFQKKAMESRFTPGAAVTVAGEIQSFNHRMQMAHPKSAGGHVPHRFSGLTPVYSERGLLKKESISRFIGLAVAALPEGLKDPLPPAILRDFSFLPITESLRLIHQPHFESGASLNNLEQPRERFMFTELLCAQLALCRLQEQREHQNSPAVTTEGLKPKPQDIFPFALTQAQHRALNDVLGDMARSSPMGRLLQGDVGSGKTAVAAAACYAVVQCGMQCAVMAPTEVLAEQHRRSFERFFQATGIRVALLTSSTKTATRKKVLAEIHSGAIQVLVGTQSLLNVALTFKKLGLTVVDEQHRFGVAQRARLRAQGLKSEEKHYPHFLAMTATPIPRSLALTLYGDLELSVIDELPPGRKPVETRLWEGDAEQKIADALQEVHQRKEKAFIIYPLIEESEKMDLSNAVSGFEKLRESIPQIEFGLLHGRMSAKDKELTINAFAEGQTQVLVSTTVVEVGVDVPEATLMVIMNAERFGLSQLHQLRGRVGRSPRKSHCLLVANAKSKSGKAARRLQVLTQTNNGFLIAAEDLNIRGPGDFLGTRQAGLPSFAFADPIRDAELLNAARQWAKTILKTDPELRKPEHQDLVSLMKNLQMEQLALSDAG